MKRLYIILLLIISFLLAGCSGSDKVSQIEYFDKENIEPKLSEEARELLKRSDLDEDIRTIIETLAVYDLPESSFQKIDKALKEGEITKEEAVILNIQAVYDPLSIPEKYKGVIYKKEKPTLKAELQWLINNWDSLDEETKNKVEPFVVAPDDPRSYYNQDSAKERNKLLKKLSLCKAALAAGSGWEKINFSAPNSETQIKIYFKTANLSSADRQKLV